MTDDVIRWHLSGHDDDGQPFVAGVYPLLQDETCFFLAVDFDKAGWREDAPAFLEACRRLNLPAALERSRSGRGAHVWLFFEEAIPAALARRLGSHVLTETMEGRPDIGLDSYDRLFPNQDTMPQGGFGNLIALPLQKGPREQGNSVFLDDDLVPWADQWAFLASVRRIGRAQVEGDRPGGRTPRSHPRRASAAAGRRRRRAVDGAAVAAPKGAADRRRTARRRWSWFSAIRSTSPRKDCIRASATGCFAWRRFRIPSSTRRRRCGCPRTTSRASSPAPRITRITSACREGASTMFARR